VSLLTTHGICRKLYYPVPCHLLHRQSRKCMLPVAAIATFLRPNSSELKAPRASAYRSAAERLGALPQTLRRPAARAIRCFVCLSAPTLLLGRSQLTLQCSDTLPSWRFVAQTLHCSGALMPWYSPAPTLYCSDALLLALRAPMLTAPTLCGSTPTP